MLELGTVESEDVALGANIASELVFGVDLADHQVAVLEGIADTGPHPGFIGRLLTLDAGAWKVEQRVVQVLIDLDHGLIQRRLRSELDVRPWLGRRGRTGSQQQRHGCY